VTSPGGYSAGTIFLTVVPSFKGLQDAIRRQAKDANRAFGDELDRDTTVEKAASRAGDRAGGAYGDRMRQQIEKALKNLPDTKVGIDSRAADAQIAVIRARLEALSGADFTIAANTAEAMSQLRNLEQELRDIAAREPDIDVKVNTLGASAELKKITAEVDRLDGRTAKVDVDTGQGFSRLKGDLNDGGNSLRAFNGLLLSAALLGPLLVPALAAVAGGAVMLGTAFLGAAAGLGVLLLAFNGILTALKAMSAADKDAAMAGERQKAQAEAVAAAQRGVRDAEESLARARENTAQATQDAARRVADAVQRQADAQKTASRDIASAQRDEADARQALADAQAKATERTIAAARQVADAEQHLADVRDRAAQRSESANRRIADAQQHLATTARDTSDRVQAALARQEQAERSLAQAVQDATSAQEALTRARRDAARDLEDLNNSVVSGHLAEEDAVLSLQDSLDKLNAARADPTLTDRERAQAEIGYARQVQSLEELRLRNRRLVDEQAAAVAAGINGSDRVKSAQERLNAALQAQVDAQHAVTAAAQETARVREDAALAMAKAERDLADAQKAATDAALTNARDITDAEQRLADARAAQAKVAQQNLRDIASAQRNLSDAVTATALAHENAAARIAAANRAVADARLAQIRTEHDNVQALSDAAQRVADSQIALHNAVDKAAVAASASVRNLQYAMDQLSPAGQAFATFIYGLKPLLSELTSAAAGGVLPGLQTALEMIIGTYGPGLIKFVGEMGKVLGDMFIQAAKTFQSPIWQDFFSMMSKMAPVFTKLFGEIGIQMLTIFAQIGTAFAPAAQLMLTALSGILGAVSKWLASPAGQKSLQEFLGYVARVGPQVADFVKALAGALINLVIALAPYAEMLLRLFTGFLEFIAGLPPNVLGAVAIGMIGLTVAVQTLLGVTGLISTIAKAFEILNTVLATTAVVEEGAAAANKGLIAKMGLWILVIAAVVIAIAILWHNSETFRDIVKGAWEAVQVAARAVADWFVSDVLPTLTAVFHAIGDAAVWMWENAIKPAIDALKVAWDALIVGMKWAWDNLLHPVFDAIGTAFSFLWTWVLKPLFAIWALEWAILLAGLKLAWDYVLHPVFEAIGAYFSFLWNWVLKPIFAIWQLEWAILLAALKLAWDYVLHPVFDAIGAVFAWMWNNVLKPAFAAVKSDFETLGAGLKAVWDKVLHPVFTFLSNIFTDYIVPAFQAGIDAIASIWDTLVGLVKTPIEFVVNTVINGGIIDTFNKLADFFNTTKIDHIPLPAGWNSPPRNDMNAPKNKPKMDPSKFADGGIVPGFSPHARADNIHAMLTAGEYVLPVGAVQALRARFGDSFLESLRRGLPGYADGGLVGGITGGLGSLADRFKTTFGDPSSLLHGAVDSLIGRIPGGNFGKLIAGVPKKLLDFAIDKAKGFLTGLLTGGVLGGDGKSDGSLGQAGPGDWPQLVNYLSGTGVPFTVSSTTGGQHAPGSYHYDGRAVDLVGPDLDAIFKAFLPIAGQLKELFYTPEGYSIKNGLRTSPIAAADHFDHVHAAYADGGYVTKPRLYDDGGMLPPGLSTVLNASGRPEPVLNGAQWDALLGRDGGSQAKTLTGTLVLDSGAFVGHVEGVIDERDRRDVQDKRSGA
jgi:phage-related protein